MARIDREAIARLDGMDYALRRIREIGTDEFEKELRWRNGNHISVVWTPDEVEKNLKQYKDRLVAFMITMAVAVLHDQFGFGKKRAAEFRNRFMLKVDCINGSYVTLEEQMEIVKEEIGIDVNVE